MDIPFYYPPRVIFHQILDYTDQRGVLYSLVPIVNKWESFPDNALCRLQICYTSFLQIFCSFLLYYKPAEMAVFKNSPLIDLFTSSFFFYFRKEIN